MGVNEEAKIWLPFPPSVNGLFRDLSPERRAQIAAGMARKGKKGRPPTRCMSAHYRRWRKEAVLRILTAKLARFVVPVVVKLELTPRDSRARDADNYAKPVLDALVEARVLVDDSNRWVKAVAPYWQNPSRAPGVMVFIRPAKALKEPLNAAERRRLGELRKNGAFMTGPHHHSKVMKALVEKGYVEELPGLFEGAPQGFVAAE